MQGKEGSGASIVPVAEEVGEVLPRDSLARGRLRFAALSHACNACAIWSFLGSPSVACKPNGVTLYQGPDELHFHS